MITFLQFLFSCWPLIIFLLAVPKRDTSQQETPRWLPGLRLLMVVWLGILAIWTYLTISGQKITGFIPAPFNTGGFLTLGLIGGCFLILHALKDHRQRKKDQDLVEKLETLRALSPGEFEGLVAKYFTGKGYRIWLTEGGQDHGVDLLVYDGKGEKWVVQCKRYKGTVGEPVVRDLVGAMLHERATRAILITTGKVSLKALEWAEDKPLVIIDQAKILPLLEGIFEI